MNDEYVKRYDAGIAIAEILSPYGEDGRGDAISREVAMSKIRHITPTDVIPVIWITTQVDKDKWEELLQRWWKYNGD